MEPKARIKSGLIAVALGLTTTFSTVGGPFSFLGNTAGNSATAQEIRQNVAAPAPAQNAQQAYLLSAQKLHAARKAVATRDIATAERLAMEVRGMNLNYRETDDRPEQVLRLIHEYKNVAELGRSAPNSEQFRRSFAVFSLNQAETMLHRGELDLALQLTQEAANQNVPYNHSERQAGLEPTAMFKRIDDARRVQGMNVATTAVPMQQPLSQAAQQHLNQSLSILRQARDAMNAGHLDRAEQLCQVASKYKLAESVYPDGADTPNRLLAEIAAKRQSAPPAMVAMQPLAPEATPAVYNAPQNPMQPIQQVRDNGPAAQPQQATPMVANNAPIVDQAMRDRQVVVNQFSTEIMQQISNAQKMSQEHRNPDAGLEILQNAKRRIEESQLDADTKRMFIVHIDRAINDTVRYVEKYEAQFELDKQNQAVWDERRRESEQFRSKEEKLKTLFTECNKLINEQRYEEAVIVAKKAREFAPDEPATHMLLTTTSLAANTSRSVRIKEEKEEGFIAWMHSVDEASIPTEALTKNPMIFGDNWAELTKRRKGTDEVLRSRRQESERMIFRRLEDPVSINLDRPMPLDQVLRILSGQTGVDIFVDWGALHEVDVTSERMVTVNIMREIRFKSVLSMILEPLGLSYVVKHEMLHITSATKAKGEMVIRPYYVGDLIMGIPNFNGQNPNDFNNALSRAIGMQAGAGSVKGNGMMLAGHTQVDPNLMAASNPGMLAQFGSGNGTNGLASQGGMGQGGYTGPQGAGSAAGGAADFGELMDLIEAVVSPDSWDEGGEMMEYYPNLSLVVRQTEEVHAEIVDLLAQLRKLNDLQIAVEVRYVTLADDFYEKMGIDFDVNFKNDGAASRVTTQLSSSGTDGGDNAGTEYTVTGGRSVTVGLSAPGEISADLSIPVAQNSYGLVDPSYGGFQTDAGITMGFALLNEIEAYFFLNATQGDTRSNILQAPKVTIFNGQMGSVTDISMQPFVTSVIPYVGDFAAAYQPVIVILNEGQYMTVQGVVSNNRQYVRLTLNPVFSKITKIDTFRYVGEDTSTDETETSAKGNDKEPTSGDERNSTRRSTRSNSGVTIQLPTLATFQVSTTVSVPDGGTILLGGIKRLSEGRKEHGVPMLNKIPYINRLFMNTAIGRSTQSIMMMVTPRIIIQEEEEEYLTGIRPQP